MTGDDSESDREPWLTLAYCEECSWAFQEHDYQEVRVDETDSRLDVAARRMAMHSNAAGHAVRYGSPESDEQDDDETEEWSEMPDYVEFIGRGVNEYQCQRCMGTWSGNDREKAATHDCSNHQSRRTESTHEEEA